MACFILFELFLLMMGLCRFQRPPGPIPSSMLGLEALTGSLEDFGFEDYLNGNDIYSFASNLNFGATCLNYLGVLPSSFLFLFLFQLHLGIYLHTAYFSDALLTRL